MISLLYATTLLAYCVSCLGRKKEYYDEITSVNEKLKKGDFDGCGETIGKSLLALFFVITEVIFYGNLTIRKVLFPYSMILFFGHFATLALQKLSIEKTLILGKVFVVGEIVFLVAYLIQRVGV